MCPGIPAPRGADAGRGVRAGRSGATFAADVVIFSGNARQLMLLSEAHARGWGVRHRRRRWAGPPARCSPRPSGTASGVASIGCIGNRVYTGLADDELYLTVPANAVAATLDKLGTIVTANLELEKFHRQRAATLGA